MLKLGRVNFNNLLGSAKEAIINRAIAYNKAYTLLHRQLVQKERVHFIPDVVLTILGRQYRVIDYYNIKSSSKEPYIPYSKETPNKNNLGLNQLFMGQDPYKKYDGDPKSGIYHDECKIYPRGFRALSFGEYFNMDEQDKKKILITSVDSWGWVIEDWDFSIIQRGSSPWLVINKVLKNTKYITKKNEFGFDSVSNARELSDEIKTEAFYVFSNGVQTKRQVTCTYKQKRYEISYKDGTKEILKTKAKPLFLKEIKSGYFEVVDSINMFLYQNLTLARKVPKTVDLDFAQKRYGKIIYKANIPRDKKRGQITLKEYVENQKAWIKKSWVEIKNSLESYKTTQTSQDQEYTHSFIIMFSNNACVKITKGGVKKVWHGSKDDGYETTELYPPSFSFIALVHADTNELALSKKEFVENWEKYFELYVYERKSFWQKIAAPLVAIVTMIIAPYLTYLALPVGATLSTTVTFFGISTTASFLVGASAFFATVGLVGSFARVPFLKVIGTIGGIGVGMVNSIWSSATTKMLKEGSLEIGVKKLSSQMVTKTAVEASKKVTFGAVLNYIKSSWLNALNSVLQIINASASLSKEELGETKEINENERNKIVVDDEDEFIRPNFIQKVIDIPKLDGKIEKIEEMEKWEQTF